MKVLLVGQTPPPANGMASATLPLLDVEGVKLVDIADRRSVNTTGRWSLANALDAVSAAIRFGQARPWRFDMVHIPVAQNTPGLMRDCVLLGICVVSRASFGIHLHGGYFAEYFQGAPKIMRGVLRLLLRHARYGIVLGEALRHCLAPVLPSDRIVVCANGCEDYGPPQPKGESPFRVLNIGALRATKGTVDLIRATANHPHWELILAGEADEAVKRELGMFDHVSWVGVVGPEQKRQLLASADVFALPTRYPFEGQPISVLEAMSAGLPIVTTRRAAIPETVRGGAIFVDEWDVDMLRTALTRLASDRNLRSELGKVNRALYEMNYTETAYAQRVRDVWEAAVRERSER